MIRKKLMILGGSRYAVPVVEEAHRLDIHVLTADYLTDNTTHKISGKYYGCTDDNGSENNMGRA